MNNIPNELKEKLDNGTAIKKPIEYKEGTVIIQFNEKFSLVERMSTYPTKHQWALARWRVAFYDYKGQLIEGDFYRPIREVGVPNTHQPDKIEGLDWIPTDNDSDDNEPRGKKVKLGAKKARVQEGRGRPEGDWNELKALNVFRDIAKGSKPYNQDKIDKATEFLKALGNEKFIEKYNKKFKEKGLLPL